MITYEARDPATVEPPPAGKYRFFCTEDGNFARMDSDGNVSTLPFSADIPDEYALPTNIVKRRILSGFLDGSEIGLTNTFTNGGVTLAALGFEITSNANGIALSFSVGSSKLVIQRGYNLIGSDGWSATYDLPVPFSAYTPPDAVIVATKVAINPGASDGDSVVARLTSTTQFQLGHNDYGTYYANWIAIGPGVT